MDGSQALFRNVWKENLEMEMEAIRSIVIDYPFVSMVHLKLLCQAIYVLRTVIGYRISGCRGSTDGPISKW